MVRRLLVATSQGSLATHSVSNRAKVTRIAVVTTSQPTSQSPHLHPFHQPRMRQIQALRHTLVVPSRQDPQSMFLSLSTRALHIIMSSRSGEGYGKKGHVDCFIRQSPAFYRAQSGNKASFGREKRMQTRVDLGLATRLSVKQL